jgi:hypothetical protein
MNIVAEADSRLSTGIAGPPRCPCGKSGCDQWRSYGDHITVAEGDQRGSCKVTRSVRGHRGLPANDRSLLATHSANPPPGPTGPSLASLSGRHDSPGRAEHSRQRTSQPGSGRRKRLLIPNACNKDARERTTLGRTLPPAPKLAAEIARKRLRSGRGPPLPKVVNHREAPHWIKRFASTVSRTPPKLPEQRSSFTKAGWTTATRSLMWTRSPRR